MERAPLGTFWYGPFPPPRSKWLPLFVLALLSPVFIGAGTQSQRLACDRGSGVCRHSQSSAWFGASERAFPIEHVREVRFVDGLGKNRGDAESVIVFASGHELRLARGAREAARTSFEELDRFFGTSGGPSLHHEASGSPIFLVLGAALALALAGFAGHLVTLIWPFRVALWRDRLEVRRPPFGATRSLELARPKGVKILDQPAGTRRVVLRTSAGEVPLTVKAYAGRAAHERAARHMAGLLELDFHAPEPERPASPRTPRRTLLLFAGVIVAGALVSALIGAGSSRTQGTLELECRTRCRFQGMECLPGGSVQMSLEPGAHTIEVWTATGSERWTPKQATIRIGETTRFVCAREMVPGDR